MTDSSSNESIPVVPDFELIREIGRGGFGQVWLAKNHATGLPRAIKLIPRSTIGSADPAGREVVSITRLESVRHRRHPNLLDIQHVGQTDEHVFFVTDLADNAAAEPEDGDREYTPATLDQRLTAGSATPAECLAWTRQLLDGLASLHEAGMVHRDVKPANCLFVDRILKLADFGLLTEADSHTSRIGTQAYMPPDGQMDARADVYAAGLVVYELIAGCPVERFPQLGDRADEIANDPTLSALLRLTLDACQTSPEDRYPDASAMLAALEQVLSSGNQRRRSRRRVIVGLAAITVIAAFFLAVFREPEPPNVEPAAEVNLVHVNFVSYPFGATVLLDGEILRNAQGDPLTTPCTIEELSASSHEVVLRHPDMPDLELGKIDFAKQQQVVGTWAPR